MSDKFTELGALNEILNNGSIAESGVYDSSSTVADRDGNLLERTEYIIDALAGSAPVNATQSGNTVPLIDTFTRFSILLSNSSFVPFSAAEIDISSVTATIERSTGGGAYSDVGITQPVISKDDGIVYTSYFFDSLEGWLENDLYRFTLAGIYIGDGINQTIQTFYWNNIVSVVSDIDTEVDFIVSAVLLPEIDDIENVSIAHAVGNKNDTVAGDSLVSATKRIESDLSTVVVETAGHASSISTAIVKIDTIQSTVDDITGYALETTLSSASVIVGTINTRTSTILSTDTAIKAQTDTISTGISTGLLTNTGVSTVSTAVSTVLSTENLIKTETDKISTVLSIDTAIKTETDKVSTVLSTDTAIKTNTDTIPALTVKLAKPTADTANDATIADVVGIKADTIDGTSLMSLLKYLKADTVYAQKVYPTLATGVTVTASASTWTLGGFIEIIPASTVASNFVISGLNVTSATLNDTYELVLYSGALGQEVEIGRTRFTKVANNTPIAQHNIKTSQIAANGRISAKIANTTGSGAAVIALFYHTF